MAGRPVFAFISLALVVGAIIFTFFVLLAGATDRSPIDKFYFLRADTSDIPGAPSESRWTFWNICSTTSSGRNECGQVRAAFPLNPPAGNNFNTETNVPEQFIGTRYYFYMTRFMFAFELIYLFFAAGSLLIGVLALCTRIGSYLAGFLAMIAAFFSAITAALMTTAYVKGRDNFNSNNQEAHVGTYSFGFMWAAFACLFIASILYCGPAGRKDEYDSYSWRRTRRTRSTRSRGSFKDHA